LVRLIQGDVEQLTFEVRIMEKCSGVAAVAALGERTERARCRCLCCEMSLNDARFMLYFIIILTLLSWV